jgi:hypothetical protein
MPCTDELDNQTVTREAAEEADLAVTKAERKVKTRIKASIAACGLGAAAAILTGLAGTIGGGAACFTALMALDDAATDYDHALAEAELAHDRHMNAIFAAFSCLSRCGPVNS